MRRPLALLAACLLFAAAPAWAANAIESARATASSARQKVSEIRSKQLYQRAELNQVATKIEALKAQQKGALLTGSDLDAQLRRSQELSGSLTETAQALSAAESDLERENLSLLAALNDELAQVRGQWDQTKDRAARAQVLERMKSLRAERDSVRAQLPAAKVPALSGAGSDDPDELLEQADAVRDSEDKVRQKMAALKTRIAELRDERELDRRMTDFLGDESMFDDTDRRLRQTKALEKVTQPSSGLFGSAPEAASDSASAGAGGGDGTMNSGLPPTTPSGGVGAPAPGGGTTGGTPGTGSNPGSTGTDTGSRTTPINITQIVKGQDARPSVGGTDALLRDDSDSTDVNALENELKQLDSLASQLDKKADDLEKRAKDAE